MTHVVAASQRPPRARARSRTDRPAPEVRPNLDAAPAASAPLPFRPSKSPWLTIPQAAAYLSVGADRIYKACATEGLKHVKFGHSTIRLKRQWLEAWAEAQVRHVE